MPPKRKQGDDAEASSSTRSTRASTRTTTKSTGKASSGTAAKKSTAKGTAKSAAATSKSGGGDADDSDGMESVHSAKKARTAGSANTRKNATKAAANQRGKQIDDEPIRKVPSTKELPPKQPASNPKPIVEAAPAPPPPAKKAMKHEPYTPQRALVLFSTYADSDDANVIGPEGFEKLCTDADMPLDGPRPIVFAWQMGAKDMAKITKDEWVSGTSTLKVSSVSQIGLAMAELEDLLINGKPPVKATAKKDQDYDRTSYFNHSTNIKAAFQKLYLFSFSLAKPEGSKNIEMDTSVAFWSVLLVPKYPIMGEVLKFIAERGTYKATNKDLWTMMLEFCETVKPSLEDYEADGAWPTLLDDFAGWKKSSSSNGQDVDMNAD